MARLLALIMTCLLLSSFDLPPTKEYINDMTGTLSKQDIAFIDRQLRSFEAEEGVQVVVVILNSLDGQSVEDAAQLIDSQWQVGHKGRDSGILLLVAKKEQASYIDLGYALDQNITDDKAQEIVKNVINPLLKRGKVEQAVVDGLSQIFVGFGKGFGSGGVVNVGSFWHMTSLLIFLASIPLLYFVARFAVSEYIWVSPVLGFVVGITQSIGLAVVLACMGGMMVLIAYLFKTYAPPRQK